MKISSNGLVLAQFIWGPVACAGFLLAGDWVASFQSQMIGFAYCVALAYVVLAPAIYRAFFWSSIVSAPLAPAAAVLAPPPGWQLVPVEPTPAMMQAAWDSGNRLACTPEGDDPLPGHQYRAMISAAPAPNQSKQGAAQ